MKSSLAVLASSLLTAALVVGALAPMAAAATPPPVPQVQGNRLVNAATGQTFIPRGVNIPGLEYSCVQGWNTLPASGEFAAIASWKINTVRLPLNQSCWLGLDGAPVGRTVAQYKADVKAWVDGATAAGLVVILDLHWNAPAGYAASGQRAMPDARSSAFWTSVATTYSAYPSVMFELFNEPYSRSGFTLTWDCWKNGGCLAPVENDETGTLSGATYAVSGMQTLVSAVRATGATQPILLGGLNYSNDLTGWLVNKPTDPLNQLVAAWHNYPGQGCSTSCWNSTIATVAASVPVVTTEFGNTAETTSTSAGSGNYLVPFMTWAEEHGIGYLPWAWWDVPASESVPNSVYALFSGSSFTPKAPSGTKFHAFLASISDSGRLSPNESYVVAAYADVLGRAPSSPDLDFWSSGLDRGESRRAVANGFNNSDEYRSLRIAEAYTQVLGREPDSSGAAWWLAAMRTGTLQPDDAYRTFLSSEEFYRIDGGGTDAGFLEALYRKILARPIDDGGLAYWRSVLSTRGRPYVTDAIWYSDETFRARVTTAYQQLLGHAADDSAQTFWVSVARAQGQTGMRSAIMASTEYFDRATARFPDWPLAG